MDRASYKREQADYARRLAEMTWQDDLEALLLRVAQDYDEIAEDLEGGAPEIRPAELSGSSIPALFVHGGGPPSERHRQFYHRYDYGWWRWATKRRW